MGTPYKMKGSPMQRNFNFTGDSASTTPKYNMKNKGNFNISGSKASTTPGFSTTKIAKGLKKAGKFLGGKLAGTLGMMGAGTLSATATPKGKAKKKGSYTDDFTKLRK